MDALGPLFSLTNQSRRFSGSAVFVVDPGWRRIVSAEHKSAAHPAQIARVALRPRARNT